MNLNKPPATGAALAVALIVLAAQAEQDAHDREGGD